MKKKILVIMLIGCVVALFSAGPITHYQYVYAHGDSLTLDSNIGGQYIGGGLQLPSYASHDTTAFLAIDDSGNVILRSITMPPTPSLDQVLAVGSTTTHQVIFQSPPSLAFAIADFTGTYEYGATANLNAFMQFGQFGTQSDDAGTAVYMHTGSSGSNNGFTIRNNGARELNLLFSTLTSNRAIVFQNKSDTVAGKTDIPTVSFIRGLFSAGSGISYNSTTGAISATGGGASGIVASVDTTATSAILMLSYSVPATGTFYINAYADVISISATTMQMTLSWIDENSNGWSKFLALPAGESTFTQMNFTNNYSLGPLTIRAKAGTSIQIATLLSGSAIIHYDAGARITKQ